MPETYGIYSGTIGEREYAHGRDDGRADANALAESGLRSLIPEQEQIGHEHVRHSMSPRTKAYWLGWLRGFREVSR